MNKKLFTVTAGFVLATVTAISAFAADVTLRAVPDTATTFSIGAQNMVVDGAYNNANVFMGNLSGNDNEFWILRQHPTGNWRLYTAKAPIVGYGYTINRHINGTNCILWPDATDASTLRDSVVDLMTVSSGVQRIKLALSVSSNQWLICNDFCQEAKCPFRSHRQYFIFTEGIWKELWVSVPGIGHSDIRGLGTAGQWSAVSSTV